MGLPQIYIFTLGMCYRYIYLFAGLVENTFKAIKCRTIVGMHYKKGQHVVTWNIAYLWMRSLKLSEDVYNAMLARGFRGEPKSTVGEV
jgi:cobalt/nickel transport system permease protein